jgi:hypothetical protein
MKKKIAIKKNVYLLKRTIKEIREEINVLQLLRQINRKQKKTCMSLTSDIFLAQRELKKIKALTKRNRTIYEGMEEIKRQIQQTENGGKGEKHLAIYRNQIRRLSTMVEVYTDRFAKEDNVASLRTLTKPSLRFSINPKILLENIALYTLEKKEWQDQMRKQRKATIHIGFSKKPEGISLTNDGTLHYKPENMQIEKNAFTTDGKHIATYYLADVPAFLSEDMLFRLLVSELPFTISIFVTPANSSELIKKARQRLSVLELQQAERLQKGKVKDHQIEKSIEEISQFIYELVHEYEKGFLFSFYIALCSDTKEEMKKLHTELKNLTDGVGLSMTNYLYGQKKAFETILPFHTDYLQQNRLLQSSAVSYFTPFTTKQIHDPKGIFLGINRFHNSLVFINPFTVSDKEINNSNITIFGQSGTGKSVTAKLLAERLYMRGIQIIIIDPEGEYVDFARKMGGEIIDFSREWGINPFAISSDDEQAILDHIGVLKTFFKFFIRPERFDSAKLDAVLMQLYNKHPKVKPTWKQFLHLLEKTTMYEDINVLHTGSLQGVFNTDRSIDLTSDFIVFNLSSLSETEEKAPAMYLLTSLIWHLSNTKSAAKKMLFIDEAHTLLSDTEVGMFYRKLVKQARKRHMGIVSITQDMQDFLDNELGKAVITNSETKIILKQSYATIPLMENIFPMSIEEKQSLGELEIGEMVLFRQNEHMRVAMVPLAFERDLIGMKR